jgi:tRNA pseudouridine38-40 synthase
LRSKRQRRGPFAEVPDMGVFVLDVSPDNANPRVFWIDDSPHHPPKFVADDFDARFSALERRYRYTILARPWPDPLRHRRVWHVANPLDRARMRLACDPLIGEHDFSSFCRRPKDRPDASLTRRVTDLRIVEPEDDVIEVRVAANAFCHQMVRSIVGVLVSAGEGRLTAADVMGILRARNRTAVPRVAPPDGLVLDEVVYPD